MMANDQVKVEAKAEEQFDNVKLDRQLDAALRTFAADKICYDRSTRNYFLHVAPHKKNEKFWDEGWYPIGTYKFHELENNTYVLGENVVGGQIYPDVTGLTCKEQKPDPEWFSG